MAVIINDFDCPEGRMIAILDVEKDGAWWAKYLSMSTRMIKCWTAGKPTPIGDFGVKLEFDGESHYRVVRTGEEGVAKYRDGVARHWRDNGREWHRVRAQAFNIIEKI